MSEWKNPLKYSIKEKAISDAILRKTHSVKHLLTPHQKLLYNFIFNSEERECGCYSSRKVGKTAFAILVALEFGWKNPGSIIRHVLSNQTQAAEIIEPLINSFIKKVIPSELLPEYKVSRKAFFFKNGSVIHLSGAHPDNIEKSAGPSCDLMIFDEIAIWEGDVHHALYDILYPQGTLTQMKKVFICTPPLDLNSYYIQKIHPKLLDKNTLITLTIDESPLLTAREIEQLAEQYGGRDSAEFRRQFLCQLIPSDTSRLTPEFDSISHTFSKLTAPPKFVEYGKGEIPQVYQYFICADTATNVNNTAILVGYYDHHLNKLIIEEEKIMCDVSSTPIAGELLFLISQYKSFSYHPEHGIIVIIDAFEGEHSEYSFIHNIPHKHALKGKVEDTISKLRSALTNDRILISKNCKRLIWELDTCVWKKSVSELKQIQTDKEGKHGDAVMALAYMLKAVNWRFRPETSGFKFKLGDYRYEADGIDKLKKSKSPIWPNIKYTHKV